MWRWLLDVVVCPVCRGRLTAVEVSADSRDAVLVHDGDSCGERYPVIDALPRLLVGGARALLRRGCADWFAWSPFGPRFAQWGSRGEAVVADLRLVARFDREWECAEAKPHRSRGCDSLPGKAQPATGNRVLRGRR